MSACIVVSDTFLNTCKLLQGFEPQLNSTVKPVLNGHLKERPKLVFKTDYRLMQVKIIASFFKIFVLSIFEWPLKTDFTLLSTM